MSDIIHNIAGYRFASWDSEDLKLRRAALLQFCREENLKGTILLSREGINLFVAGSEKATTGLLMELRSWPGLADLEVKVSPSIQQPFNRMLVRIKKEIIAFGVEGIRPAEHTSEKLPAHTLKEWLDAGKPVTLLDTRNDYEVKLGTFQNALPIGIDHFRHFPEGVARLPEALKEQPIVMFCTGGIRCEKAGPFMERAGFKHIFQLEGGILKYFEECGGAHYDGECFVFDQRVGVDPALQETDSTQCFACLTPLTSSEQADVRFVIGKSCPYCFRNSEDQSALRVAERQAAFDRVSHPLPGSIPYDNFRPVSVPPECHGLSVREFLSRVLPHVAPSEWERLQSLGLVVGPDRLPVSLGRIVETGERYGRKFPNLVEPAVSAEVRILYEDEAIIVLTKPAPLPIHAGGRFNRNTLEYLMHQAYAPEKPRSAHRLDANTTGVMVWTRSRHFAGKLQPQFAQGTVEKIYLARVTGHPIKNQFVVEAPISQEPSDLGSREVDEESGLAAVTDVTVLKRFEDGTALVEARPRTGRTNQIRIHLWHHGHPVVGDLTYLSQGRLGNQQTRDLGDGPLCLHASQLCFDHPVRGERMRFVAPSPAWADS